MPASDPTDTTPLSLLQSSALLDVLAPEELKVLAANSEIRALDKGEIVWLAGDQVDFFGLVGAGFVKMVRNHLDGSTVTIELMGPGQIFGMLGTIDATGCPLTAMAVTDLTYLRIAKKPFLTLYESSIPLKDRLVKRTSLRLHGAMDLVAKMSSGRVEERIAAILFVLAESYGERQGRSLTLRVPLTRQDIAEMAGTTVESCIRAMSRWQKDGLVTTNKHIVSIVDESALGQAVFRQR